jgi:murein DD-endopeptidase MepM/ murein hydrolase activator NlpD
MEEKPPIRWTAVLKVTRRGLFGRAALVVGVMVLVCVLGLVPWRSKRGGKVGNPRMLDFGPRRRVPSVLAAVGVKSQPYVASVLDAFGVGPRRYVPNVLPVSLEAGWVSSEFGSRIHPITGRRHDHSGIDLAVDEGVPVRATADGKVIFARDAGNSGRLVKIDHGNGIETRYAHNSVLKVKTGEVVRRGQVIALAGHTGRATGDHLHYEVWVNGAAVNPRNCLPEKFVEGGRQRRRQ